MSNPASRQALLQGLLRCPACHGMPVPGPEQGFTCPRCELDYPIVAGRPVFMLGDARAEFEATLATAAGRRMVAEYAGAATPATDEVSPLRRYLRPPDVMLRYYPDVARGPAAPLFARVAAGGTCVNIGGGPYRVTEQELTLNIAPFHNVDVVADAHDIPLDDDSVDCAFSLAVLEHVTDPYRVAREMMRIVRPGGYVYSEIPFIFFFHGYPADYTRFTRLGIARLFDGLDELEIGMTHGPVSAILQSANMILPMLMPKRVPLLSRCANGAFRLLLFPFKYLDLLLRQHPEAHVLAGGFYVLGRKPGGCR